MNKIASLKIGAVIGLFVTLLLLCCFLLGYAVVSYRAFHRQNPAVLAQGPEPQIDLRNLSKLEVKDTWEHKWQKVAFYYSEPESGSVLLVVIILVDLTGKQTVIRYDKNYELLPIWWPRFLEAYKRSKGFGIKQDTIRA